MNPRPLPNPPARSRRRLGEPELQTLELELETITPILGGAPKPRQLDAMDIIRAATVRGHLRFWWRAVHGPLYPTSRELAQAERARWGGAGSSGGERSRIEIAVLDVAREHPRDEGSPRLGDRDAYALWPARETKEQSAAPRWKPGLRFRLQVRAPEQYLPEVIRALRAWILFGGYGSRTRRGCGSLTLAASDPLRKEWLPARPSMDEFRRLLGGPGLVLFGDDPGEAREVPQLRGARLYHASPRGAREAWEQSLAWLRDFRQGTPPGKGPQSSSRHARNSGKERPGRSNWPEADKIRRYADPGSGARWAHESRPQYTKAPAWPRAGFGLPLIVHFQNHGRRIHAPTTHMLHWVDAQTHEPIERLASPLILKAMPLADGRCAPIAVWLSRSYPAGEVVLVGPDKKVVPGSQAPFERILAPGDEPLFEPLRGATTLRDAFFSWLTAQRS